MVLSGVSVFFIALLQNGTQSLVMSCVFSAISVMGWNSLDVLGVELFPTKLRYRASHIGLELGCHSSTGGLCSRAFQGGSLDFKIIHLTLRTGLKSE